MSLSLKVMAQEMDLPETLDSGSMKTVVSESTDLTDLIVYNVRDADLHAWLAKRMGMCERMCALAGAFWGTIQDATANNVGAWCSACSSLRP